MEVEVALPQPNNRDDELEQQKIDELYGLLKKEETKDYLDDMEKRTTCDTPLHEAAAAGMTRWALEVANLKPSLARKLNHEGLSPMHLALRHGHVQTVRALMAFNSDLIRVKGRDLVTPLHYAAELEEIELLAEFLSTCPSSIEDLTSRCETAMHIAVRNKRLDACKVLVGWMRRMDLDEILSWKDGDGNTVLHIATLTNQPEVMKLLIGYGTVNAKNFAGLTALDLYHSEGHLPDAEVKKILHGAKGRRASEVLDSLTGAGYLCQTKLSIVEWRDRRMGLTSAARRESYRNDLRNMALIVAVLIATATYQGVLSPPGGYWQDYSTSSTTMTATTPTSYAPAPALAARRACGDVAPAPAAPRAGDKVTPAPTAPRAGGNVTQRPPHTAGKMIMSGNDRSIFAEYNSAAFILSMLVIAMSLLGMHLVPVLTASIFYMMATYAIALWSNAMSNSNGWRGAARLFVIVIVLAFCLIPWMTVIRQERRKSRLDTPGRCVGGLLRPRYGSSYI